MHEDDFETAIKVVVVGNGNVGKSSMIRRFCKNEYLQTYKKTIGVDYQERELQINNEPVRMMVWDCAGQEDFDQITRDYYENAEAVVLAFSATDRASFDMIKGWKSKLESVLDLKNITAVLVQNKSDELEQTQIDPKEAETLARELRIRFYRISVKANMNVEDVFTYLAETHLKKKKEIQDTNVKPKTAALFTKETSQNPPIAEATTGKTQRRASYSRNKKDCIIS